MNRKRSYAAVDNQEPSWSSHKKQKQNQNQPNGPRTTRSGFTSPPRSAPHLQNQPSRASEASVRRRDDHASDQSNGINPSMPPPPLPLHAHQDPLILLRSLLDQLTDLNTPLEPQALEHARNLHRTLYHDPRQTAGVTASVAALDARCPPSAPYVPVPPYRPRDLERNDGRGESLPLLPEIRDEKMAKAVFTHSSTSENASQNYDRLEFLGDAYIEVISTRLIFSRFPSLPTGAAAQLRESLVNNQVLAGFSRNYGFGDRVRVAGHERDAKVWTKILADVFEAYVAAVILSRPQDGGFEAVEEWLTALWAPQLLEVDAKYGVGAGAGGVVDTEARQRLANMLLLPAKGIKLEYKEEGRRKVGRNGTPVFSVGVYLTGWGYHNYRLGGGEGSKKAVAEAEAAKDAFIRSRDVIEQAGAMKLEEVRKKNAAKEERERMAEWEKQDRSGKEGAEILDGDKPA